MVIKVCLYAKLLGCETHFYSRHSYEQSIEAINAKTDDPCGDVAARYFVEVNMSRDELYYRLGEDLEDIGGLRIEKSRGTKKA